MNFQQAVSWLVSVGHESMADRGVEQLDGAAVRKILEVAGDLLDEAAEAIRQLATGV